MEALTLDDDNIRHILGYCDIILRYEPLQFRLHAGRVGKMALLLLQHKQQREGIDIVHPWLGLMLSFDELLASRKSQLLPPDILFSIDDVLYSLPGASRRCQYFWLKLRARQHYYRITRVVIPILNAVTASFTHAPQAPCDVSDAQALLHWLAERQKTAWIFPGPASSL